jgi:hypothetical protein
MLKVNIGFGIIYHLLLQDENPKVFIWVKGGRCARLNKWQSVSRFSRLHTTLQPTTASYMDKLYLLQEARMSLQYNTPNFCVSLLYLSALSFSSSSDHSYVSNPSLTIFLYFSPTFLFSPFNFLVYIQLATASVV